TAFRPAGYLRSVTHRATPDRNRAVDPVLGPLMGAKATPRNRAAIAIACLLALLGFATVVAMSVRDADAKSAQIIGKTKKTPDPACPKNCNVAGSVTGFQ